MNIRYHKLLEIKANHNYFPENAFSTLSLVPLMSTAKKLENYQMLLQKHGNIFSVYGGLDEGIELNKEVFSGLSSLHFQLLTSDPYFFNYTNLDILNDSFLFFGNVGFSEGALQQETYVSASDSIQIRPFIFNLPISEGTSEVTVTDADGNELYSSEVGEDQNQIQVDISPYGEGVREVYFDQDLKATFFATNETLKSGCLGLIEIDLASALESESLPATYSIDFDARASHLRYKIIVTENPNLTINSLKISGSEGENYSGPVEEDFMGDQKAQVFVSDQALKMQFKAEKFPTLQLQYSDQGNGNQEPTRITLPRPGPEQLEKYNTEGNEDTFLSTSIIYV